MQHCGLDIISQPTFKQWRHIGAETGVLQPDFQVFQELIARDDRIFRSHVVLKAIDDFVAVDWDGGWCRKGPVQVIRYQVVSIKVVIRSRASSSNLCQARTHLARSSFSQ